MPVPVLSVQAMRAWEKASWDAGLVAQEVIAEVGRQLAGWLKQHLHPGETVLLLAGKGHNGDDARAMQPHLPDHSVRILNLRDPITDCRRLEEALAARPAWVVDALFGIGLNRPLTSDWAQLIQILNDSRLRVLSVDVPSGLDADSGEVQGAAVRATVTATVGAPKRGLLQPEAWEHVGRLEVFPEVGLGPRPSEGSWQWSLPEDFRDCPSVPSVAAHKGSFGHLWILAGSVGYHGAAVLSARAAQRARTGLVTLETPAEVYLPVAAQLQGPMVRPWQPASPAPERCTGLLMGPGLAGHLPEGFRERLQREWLESPHPVVADASALNGISPGPFPAGAVRVITPHPGEAARLLGGTAKEVQSDRLGSLRRLSEKLGNCWVVLKGHQTLVGRSDSAVYVNGTGSPDLAQGGSGDILAGFLAGLLARPDLVHDPLQAIRLAVWRHGAAADRLSKLDSSWTVEDLAGEIRLRD